MRSIRRATTLAAGLLAAALAVPLAPPSVAPAVSAPPSQPGGPAKPAKPDCGARVAKPGGGNWTCTLAEEFAGSALDDAVWAGHNLLGSGDMCVLSTPRTVSVSGGALHLSVVPADATTQCPRRADGTRGSYVAGWATTYHRFSQQYGRFEARMRVQAASAPGLHEAFWLWPDTRYAADSPWPETGEIDIVELHSSHPDMAVPFLHYSDDRLGPVHGLNTSWTCATTRGAWHTYTLEWFADRVTILVDGKTCLTNTAGASSFQKPFIINLTQLLGSGTNAYDGRVPLPATMDVDYVKVWR
ncbi:Beta-glucanase/Beta-glucan synthetase [Nocardioides sp. J9]|uniref:glycoside hydrolase family 16 protein n=1 Tax=unclassified Nocardioides TaxID=2615069 RepID=UPI00048AA617|nr:MULTISPECIES: glycoside hydrolase family 16 protein [unclassified Nocardioides]TWG99439.1 Beta-glucanase/Beta-glucan synthetase [Nocardioides sp. J9]